MNISFSFESIHYVWKQIFKKLFKFEKLGDNWPIFYGQETGDRRQKTGYTVVIEGRLGLP